MEKTILQWLNEIEEPEIREAAIKNASEARPCFIHELAPHLGAALIRSFTWDETKERFKFWENYYQKLIQQGK